MPIKFQCSCGRKLRAKDSSAGKTITCPECKSPIDVPLPDTTDDEWDEMEESAPRTKTRRRPNAGKKKGKKSRGTGGLGLMFLASLPGAFGTSIVVVILSVLSTVTNDVPLFKTLTFVGWFLVWMVSFVVVLIIDFTRRIASNASASKKKRRIASKTAKTRAASIRRWKEGFGWIFVGIGGFFAIIIPAVAGSEMGWGDAFGCGLLSGALIAGFGAAVIYTARQE